MRLREALNAATARLQAVSDTPRLDAELLAAHALGTSREALLLGRLDDAAPAKLEPLIVRRLAHEPVAYITGLRDFWTIELEVGPGVLIPRPDSETLIEAAVEHFGKAGPARVLDLGTGPGTLLLAALAQWPAATGLGVDRSPDALRYARRNAERVGCADRAAFRLGDWAQNVEGRFDLVLCNPPYVESDARLDAQVAGYEPAEALFAGPDGLDDYRTTIPQLHALLSPRGMIAVEIGATQGEAVSSLFRNAGLTPEIRRDLGGRDRAIVHFSLGIGG